MITVTDILRYPIKGLNADPLKTVDLTSGRGLPFDRKFAIENGTRDFDPDDPQHFPKVRFLMLARHERMATLRVEFDEKSGQLSVFRGKKRVAGGNLFQKVGRQLLEQFFSAYMSEELVGPPHLVTPTDPDSSYQFSDVNARVVSIINLASVRDLSRIVGQELDPQRFRGNIHIDGLDAWSELKWEPGIEFTLGTARLKMIEPIVRCPATNVNLETAERDLNIPQALLKAFNHSNMGIYCEVIGDGNVSVNDELIL